MKTGIKKILSGLLIASIGVGFSAPMLRVFPDSPFNFGPTTIDTSSTAEFSLTNIGTGTLRVCGSSISMGTPNFEIVKDECSGKSLGYGQSCVLGIKFTPNLKVDNVGAAVVIYDDDDNSTSCDTQKSFSISLSGSGTAIRVVKVNPSPTESGFGFTFPATDFQSTSTITLRICNAAGDTLYLGNPALEVLNTPDSPAFGVVSSNCSGAALAYTADNEDCSKNFCEFNVVFQPQSGYPYSKTTFYGSIRINDLNGGTNAQASNAQISLVGSVNPPAGVIFADIGQTADQVIQLNFTCPDDPATATNTTTYSLTYSLSGSTYFSLPNGAQACPTQCTENGQVYCNLLVRFAPQTPGTFIGRVVIGYPGGSLTRAVYGVAGSATGNYLDTDPDVVDLGKVFRLNVYQKSVIVKNVTGSELEFQPQPVGSGLRINSVACSCNDGYQPNTTNTACVPGNNAVSQRAYKLRPGEMCSIVISFTPPIVSSLSDVAILFDTPAQIIAVPVVATMEAPSPPTSPSTGLPSFGSGGGCNTGVSILGLLAIPLFALVRRLFR